MNASRLVFLAVLLFTAFSLVACGSSSGSDSDRNAATSRSPDGAVAGNGDAGTLSFQQSLKVILTTTLGLAVQDMAAAYDRVARLTREHGGYVAFANVASGQRERDATVELRVPASQADAYLGALKTQPDAHVTSEAVTSREVTADYTDLQARLLNLRRTEAQYQELLTRAGSIDEILTVTSRLNSTREDIERVQGRIRLIDDQVEFVTVRLNLTLAPIAGKAGGSTGPFEVMVRAWNTTTEVAWFSLSVLAALAVVALWLAPITVAVLVARRLYRRAAPFIGRLRF